jgi:hypothetical protein
MSDKCSESVYNNWHFYPCNNKGKVQRDGKWYCGVHDPIAKAERAANRGPTQYERECARREKREAERAALIDVARAADKVKGVRLETVTYVRLRAALNALPKGVLN